ncbi:MAG: hypothetical protein PHV82_18005, partial [Victivallaceae bacterium]|nr:hypothetical protein [Victivallaceae bacterium]
MSRIMKEINFGTLIATIVIFIMGYVAVNAEDRGKEMRDIFPYGVHIGFSFKLDGCGRPYKNDAELKEAVERVCKDLKNHHMSAAMVANCRVKDIDLWLAAAEKHGIKLFFQGGGFPMFIRAGKQLDENKETVKTFWKNMAEKYKNNKTLLAWSLTEERPPDEKLAVFLAEIVKMMAGIDPDHPAFVIDNKAPAGELYARILKPRIVCTDRYPFFLPHIW